MTEGLRERKKRQTRAAIAQAAMRLFAERSFDAVTVADVARAADVSEKTVFNHFATKEDLVLAAGAERRAALAEAIRTRPPGSSLVQPFRELTRAYLDHAERDPEAVLAVPRLVMASRSLRERLFVGWEQEAALIAPLVAAELDEPADGLVPAIVARTLAWAHRSTTRAAFTRLLAGEDARAVAADLREQSARAYDLLEDGLGELGS
jgi:AcrR family transcriptional regulator